MQSPPRFLTARFGADASTAVELRGGEWSQALSVRSGNLDLVVRFNPDRYVFDVDSYAQRFASADLPIPRVIEVGECEGGYYAISERCSGQFLDELDWEALRPAVPSTLNLLAALRAADLSSSTGYGGWTAAGDGAAPTWREFLLGVKTDRERYRGWQERLAQQPEAQAAFDIAYRAFGPLVDRCPEVRHLIHGDLLHFNVFVERSRISGVIDWQCAMYGDFLFDLAWITFWAPWFPAMNRIDWVDEMRRAHGWDPTVIPEFEARMRCYQLRIGLDHMIYQAWRGYLDHLRWTAARTLQLT